MKFTCTQENLNKGLTTVSHVASKNITLPILNNILIKAEAGKVEFMATNLEIGITASVRGKIDQEGSYTAPAKLMNDFVNLLPQENVEIELKENGLSISANKSSTLMKGSSAEDFPLIPKIEQKDPIMCNGIDLRKALGQVIFAAAVDEMRPEISGVLFVVEGSTITLVATDSYRLAEKKMSCENKSKKNFSVIIPLNTLHELVRIIGENSENVNIYLGENQVLFMINDIQFISRLVEGNYPDYKQIIPKTHDSQSEVSVTELSNSVKAASLFCKPGINDVNILLNEKENKLSVSASNTQSGESKTIVDANISGKDNEIVFNYRYLLDGLAALNDEEAIIELTTGTSPGLLRPLHDNNYTYIIMPIRQ